MSAKGEKMTLCERVVWGVGRWLGISAYHRSPGIALYGGTKLSGQRLRIFSGKRSCGRALESYGLSCSTLIGFDLLFKGAAD